MAPPDVGSNPAISSNIYGTLTKGDIKMNKNDLKAYLMMGIILFGGVIIALFIFMRLFGTGE